MNHTVYYDPPFTDDERRTQLYAGQLFVYSPRPSSLAFCEFARGLIREAFAPLDPLTAQHELDVARYAEILGKLKPAFIHHPDAKRHLRAVLVDLGCDPEQTYFDVPRMRSSTSRRLPHHRHRLCLASAPRHLVLGAGLPAQLVDPHLPDRFGQRDGVPPALLRRRR